MTVVPFNPVPVPSKSEFDELVEEVNRAIKAMWDAFRAFQSVFNAALRTIQTASLGLASNVVNACIDAFNWLMEQLEKAVNEAVKIFMALAAPWFIKAIGDGLEEHVLSEVTTLAESLNPEETASKAEWTGEGAKAFFATVTKQGSAMTSAQSAIRAIANNMSSLGQSGEFAVIQFFLSIGTATVALCVGIPGLTPPVTPAGVIASTVGVGAIISAIHAIYSFISSQTQAVSAFKRATADNLSGSSFPGGSWPPGVAAGQDGATMGDGTVTDGDADWSRQVG
ncbi:MAG: hypothetical protein ACTH2Q_05840 [Propionibacteriaceae bacterium]